MVKPGGCSLPVEHIVKATKLAAQRSAALHEELVKALAELDRNYLQDREISLNNLRRWTHQQQQRVVVPTVEGASQPTQAVAPLSTMGGIDRSDPILAWANTHQAAGLRDD
jgi:hypothetical protein